MDDNLRILRDFSNGLEALVNASLNPDGTLKDGAVDREAVLVDRVVTQRKLSFTSAFFAVSGGAANAYTAAFTPALSGGYSEGMVFWIRANHTNTGPATLNVDGQGAVAICKEFNTPVDAGDIQAGQIFVVAYELASPCFQLVNTLPTDLDLGTALQILRVNAGVTDREWITPYFVGANTPFGSGAVEAPSWAHGFSQAPDQVTAVMVCTDAGGDQGYAQGDMLDIAGREVTGADVQYFEIMKNATNIVVIYDGTEGLRIRNKTTGVDVAADKTKWQLKVYATRFSF